MITVEQSAVFTIVFPFIRKTLPGSSLAIFERSAFINSVEYSFVLLRSDGVKTNMLSVSLHLQSFPLFLIHTLIPEN